MPTERQITIPDPATCGAEELIALLEALGFKRGDPYRQENQVLIAFVKFGWTLMKLTTDDKGNIYDCDAALWHRTIYDNAQEIATEPKTPDKMDIYELRSWLSQKAMALNALDVCNLDAEHCEWRDLYYVAAQLKEKAERIASVAGRRGGLA